LKDVFLILNNVDENKESTNEIMSKIKKIRIIYIQLSIIIVFNITITFLFAQDNNITKDTVSYKTNLEEGSQNNVGEDYLRSKVCENQSAWLYSINKDKKVIIIPPNSECTIKEYFNDNQTAIMAKESALMKFAMEAARYAGQICGGFQKHEDGELIKDVYLKAYMQMVNPQGKIFDRGIGNTGDKWWVKVRVQARIEKVGLEEIVKNLVDRITNNESEKQELLAEVAYYKKFPELFKQAANELKMIKGDYKALNKKYRKLEKSFNNYKDLQDWNMSIRNNKIEPQDLKYYEKSTNPIVRKRSTKLQTENFINENRLKEAIYHINYLIKTGEETALLYNQLGLALWLAENKYGEAEMAFRKALDLKPEKKLKKEIFYNLSTVLGLQTKFQEGLDMLNLFNNSEPLDKDGKILRASLLSRHSQKLICKDLKEACGDNKSGDCISWKRALQNGDCYEWGVPGLDQYIK